MLFRCVLIILCLIECCAAEKLSAGEKEAMNTHGHEVQLVNLTNFMRDLNKRLQFALNYYKVSQQRNDKALRKMQQASFVIAATVPPVSGNDQDYQALYYGNIICL